MELVLHNYKIYTCLKTYTLHGMHKSASFSVVFQLS